MQHRKLNAMLTPRIRFLFVLGVLLLLTACVASTPPPLPTATPTITLTPTATLTPTPIPTLTATPSPTPTPVPALMLTLPDLHGVSPLAPFPLTVALAPMTENALPAAASAVLTATLHDPAGALFATLPLTLEADHRYTASAPVTLPLDALPGAWQLVITVTAAIEVHGARELNFEPARVAFHELAGVLPSPARLLVPAIFEEVSAEGDDWAGGRVWRHENSELALWWVPGPTKPLAYDTALLLLESTYEPDRRGTWPEVLDFEKTTWGARPAFHFRERWPGRAGGEAEAWIIQGKDYELYLLRVRPLGGHTVHPLVMRVAETFRVQ